MHRAQIESKIKKIIRKKERIPGNNIYLKDQYQEEITSLQKRLNNPEYKNGELSEAKTIEFLEYLPVYDKRSGKQGQIDTIYDKDTVTVRFPGELDVEVYTDAQKQLTTVKPRFFKPDIIRKNRPVLEIRRLRKGKRKGLRV